MRIPIFIFAALIFLRSTALLGTTFINQPFPDSVQDAPFIVRGRVGEKRIDWSKGQDGPKRIYTFYELRIEEVFKGDMPSSTLTMREMGGEKDGVGMQVAGSARFETGEDVVVFLSPKNPEGSHDIMGLMMGKFNIRKDEAGKEYLIGPALSLPASEGEDEGQSGTGGSQRWTLDALRSIVRDHADRENSKVDSSGSSKQHTPSPKQQSSQNSDQASGSTASQLQPSSPEASESRTFRFPLGIAIGLLGGVGALIALRRKKQ